MPKSVGGFLNLSKLTFIESLTLPQYIDGSLLLTNLRAFKNLTFPQKVGATLDLSSLAVIQEMILPKSIGGYLFFKELNSLIGISLPENIGEKIKYMDNFYTLEELRKIQQEEIVKEKSKHNRKGFTIGIYTITLVLIIIAFSVLIGLLFIK